MYAVVATVCARQSPRKKHAHTIRGGQKGKRKTENRKQKTENRQRPVSGCVPGAVPQVRKGVTLRRGVDGCSRFLSPAYFIPIRFKLGAVCLLPHPIGGRPRDTSVLGHNAGGAAVWIACEPPEVTRGYKLVVDGTVPVESDDVTGMEQRHTQTSVQVTLRC